MTYSRKFVRPMRIWGRYLKLLSLPLLCASLLCCTPRPDQLSFINLNIPWTEEKIVWIEIAQADLEIQGQSSPMIIVDGLTSNPDTGIRKDEDDNNIWIMIGHKDGDERHKLSISLPNGSDVVIYHSTGTAYLHDYEGQVRYESVSADIVLEHITGNAHVTSRRGSIHIAETRGEIRALAEADEIVLSNLSGTITGTNIMGDITFSGLVTNGDSARFETDHGAVSINLDPQSAAQIHITSAGGRIVCTLPGMSGMFESCEGQLGIAGGSLEIRTVSGAIRLDQTP